MNTHVNQNVYAFPLSNAQKRLWILSKFEKVNSAYNMTGVLKIFGMFNIKIFEKCIHDIIQKHETLRTTFREIDGEIMQIVHEGFKIKPNYFNLTPGEDKFRLHEIIDKEARNPFDLEKGPLLNITIVKEDINRFSVIISMHHIISDGWSLSIFIKECSRLYNNYIHKAPALPEALPVQYADYAIWEKEQDELNEHVLQIEFWKKNLEKHPNLLKLPYKYQRPPMQSYNGAIHKCELDINITKKLKQICQENMVSNYMFYLSVFNILLRKYSGQNDIIIGTPIANRYKTEVENIIGFFVNTLLIRTKINDHQKYSDYLNTVKEKCLQAFENKSLPFEKIIDIINPPRNTSYNPLFQVMFNMETMPAEEIRWEGLSTIIEPVEGIFSKFDLTLSIREKDQNMYAIFEYCTALFDEEWIRQFAKHYRNLLVQICNSPSKEIARLEMLDSIEKDTILRQWNDTQHEFPKENSFIDVFFKQVTLNPEKPAFEAKSDTYSYRQLHELSDKYAGYFKANGISKGMLVAVYLKRDKTFLPSILALIKSGVTYVPIDPSYPLSRIEFILKDSGANMTLVNNDSSEILGNLNNSKLLSVDKEDIAQSEYTFNYLSAGEFSESVYMIYTSGSTGQPKGVRIPHNALLNFLYSMADTPGCHENDRLLALTSLAFDISGLELYMPLICGATVVLADEETTKNAFQLAEAISKYRITIIQATPSIFKMLKEINWEPKNKIKVLCGGEALPKNIAEWLLKKNVSLWNMYGPTEATIWSSVAKIEDPELITIGKPIHNTQFYILDNFLNPQPVGVTGDLYIGGDGLAIDYYKRPELTSEKFIQWHYQQINQRIYKTGDLARYNPDGTIDYLGRSDNQVKVNGYRIELGEIESKIADIEYVEQCVAAIRKDRSDNNMIIGYIKTKDNQPLTVELLRGELHKTLPGYMIPSHFVSVTKFPLTPNGKIDRNKLPDFEASRIQAQAEYVSPSTSKEKIFTSIWEEVLGIDRIGINDNFFRLGGASLQSISISAKAEKAGLIVTPEKVFEFQTIRELALATDEISGLSTGSGRILQDELTLPDDFFTTSEKEINADDILNLPCNIKIESIGKYLPENEVTARKIVEQCKREVRFPLERLTGIKSLRVSEEKNSFDLAAKAIEKCMAISKYTPEHIDLLIVCNIFQMENEKTVSIEPGLAIQLKKRFGFINALCIDITNACTGMFTSILLAESYIKTNSAQCCMLVCGEYITHLTRTVQYEIENYLDARIAGLTLGDSGFAMILENSNGFEKGFHDLDLFTMGAYSDLCIVKATKGTHGGLFVSTDAIRMAEAGHVEGAKHALKMVKKKKWNINNINYIIMHQASSTTTLNSMKEINKVFKAEITNESNVIDNIKFRGNTATTTHWLAVADNIDNGRIKNNENIVFCISGSGLTLGTALYSLDDLPERVREFNLTQKQTPKLSYKKTTLVPKLHKSMTINNISVVTKESSNGNGMSMLFGASKKCIEHAGIDKNKINVVIYNGVHRDEYIYEPAISTFLTGNLKINANVDAIKDGRNSFAFDICGGGTSFLKSCYTLIQLTNNKRCETALIASSEIDNNKLLLNSPNEIKEGGSATLLSSTHNKKEGFGNFIFSDYPEFIDEIKITACMDGDKSFTSIKENTGVYRKAIPYIVTSIERLLKLEGLNKEDITIVFPPLSSNEFLSDFSQGIFSQGVAGNILSFNFNLKSPSSLTLPLQIEYAWKNKLVHKGDIALFVSLNAGIQMGCAIYYF